MLRTGVAAVTDVLPATGTVHACLADLRRAAGLAGEGAWAERFAGLQERLSGEQVSLAVLGQFKRGKSTLINALLGADVLPTAVVPLTSVVTVLEHGAEPGCLVRFLNGQNEQVPINALWDYATEAANPKNEKGVREIRVLYPSPLLTRGVRIIDTPGIGSVYEHNTDVTLGFLPQVDAALFLLSVDPPLTKVELDFLHEARAFAGKILFLLNKIDAFDQAAVDEAMAFTKGILKGVMEREGLEILPLSAREGLAGRLEADEDLVRASGVAALEERLGHFLRWERAAALSQAVAKSAAAAARELDFSLRLSQEAVRTPAEVLEQKIKAFTLDLERAELSRREILGLVETESRAVAAQLDEELAAFRQTASQQIYDELASGIAGSAVPLARARAVAEGRLEELIEKTFNPWVEAETGAVADRFEAVARRLEGRVRDHLQAVRQAAGDLFDIPAPTATVELTLVRSSDLYYVVGDPEPFLPMPEWRTIVAYLPRRFALPRVLEIVRREVWSEVDRNTGRVRHDLLERLEKSTRRLRSGIIDLLQMETNGLWVALQTARSRRAEGRDAVETRLCSLGQARAAVSQCLQQLEELA